MPKLVDHAVRRDEIAQATWAVVGDIGLERVRLRDIAAATGFTTGVLAHYFPNKDSVLRYSFELAYEHCIDQIDRSNAAAPTALERVENTLVALIPDKQRPESIAFIAMCFGIRNSNDPVLATTYKNKRNEYRKRLKSHVRDAFDEHEISDSRSFEEVLDLALAVLDGVCVAALLNPEGYPKARGARVVKTLMKQIFVAD